MKLMVEAKKLLILYALVLWMTIIILIPFKLIQIEQGIIDSLFFVSVIVLSVFFSIDDRINKIYNYLEKVGE